MQTRTYPEAIIDAIVDGLDCNHRFELTRLYANAHKRQVTQVVPTSGGRFVFGREDDDDRERAWSRAWDTLTASQKALATSVAVGRHGGNHLYRFLYWPEYVNGEPDGEERHRMPYSEMRGTEEVPYSIAELSEHIDVSPRLIKMAVKLRKVEGKREVLIRAVAAGTIGLGDAVAHTDRSTPELRRAISKVKAHRARSLRQALEG
jgi:hypothetical protein